MSAYIVEKRVIDFLAGCIRYLERATGQRFFKGNAVECARMLYRENVEAVEERYPHCTRATFLGSPCEEPVFTEQSIGEIDEASFDPDLFLERLRQYSYQCCGRERWEGSELDVLTTRLNETARGMRRERRNKGG